MADSSHKVTWYRFVAEEHDAGERAQTHICEHQLSVVHVRNWDLGTVLRTLPREPFVMVEWDIAFEPVDMHAMEQAIGNAPLDVHVAPYLLYPQSTGLADPVLAHRRIDIEGAIAQGGDQVGYRWIQPGEQRCDAFGLGLIYWPLELLEVALKLPLNDHSFDVTLSRAWGWGANVVWDARPVHLHWSLR